MFDNPNKALRQLEDRLLAAEKKPEAEIRDDDPDTALAEVKAILAKDERESGRRQPMSQTYVAKRKQELLREEDEKAQEIEKMKRPNTGGLMAALMLELAVLMGIIAWWCLCKV